jgi:hypothetical protein
MEEKNKNLNGISVILPIHELDEQTKELLNNAIYSVISQTNRPDELLLVIPKESNLKEYLETLDFGDYKDNVRIVENDGKTDFSSQINYGASVANTEWISILELDDEYASTWFKNVITYREAHKDVDMFAPIIIDVDASNQFIGLMNEAVWAHGFSDELGILDNNSLLVNQNFNIDGLTFKKSLLETYGGFKSNIKLTFIYEFLLRMTFKAVKLMVIPRFGYKHKNQRPNSLFYNYKETIKPLEARWWLDQAKREYYFNKDREISYVEQIN